MANTVQDGDTLMSFNVVRQGDDGEFTKEELIRLEPGKFFWKGQEVDDVNDIYGFFTEFMHQAKAANKDTQ